MPSIQEVLWTGWGEAIRVASTPGGTVLNRQDLCFKWEKAAPKGSGESFSGGQKHPPPLVEARFAKCNSPEAGWVLTNVFSEQSPAVNMKIMFPDGVDGEDRGWKPGTIPHCLTRSGRCLHSWLLEHHSPFVLSIHLWGAGNVYFLRCE